MKKTIFSLLALGLALSMNAQKYGTKTGHISFFSSTSIEDIKADNHKVNAVIDAKSGAMEFSMLMTAFKFKKAEMENHFNENYVESKTYPKATFKGKILNIADVKFDKDGTYKVTVEGDMTIHGVTKKVKNEGTVTVKAGKVEAFSEFFVQLADYKINVPALVKKQIADKIKITVDIKDFAKL